MLRLAALRFGGGVRRRRTSTAVIDAAVRAAFAELFPPPSRGRASAAATPSRVKSAKRKGKRAASRAATPVPASAAASKAAKPSGSSAAKAAPAAPPGKALSPPSKKTNTAGAPPTPAAASQPLVDVVLSGVNCTLLKHVLSASSSSSTSTDIPDVARVLRLDYTTVAKQHQLAHLADILLVNRIHSAVIADVRAHGRAYASAGAAAAAPHSTAHGSAPLVVLVETNLPNEEAEVQQFIIRNALQMHPLPAAVQAAGQGMVRTPPLTVLVLGDEHTARVRALAELPPSPSRVPGSTTAAAPPLAAPKPAKGAAPAAEKATAPATAPAAPAVADTKPAPTPAPTPAPARHSVPAQATAAGKRSPSVDPTTPTELAAASPAPPREPTAASTTAATPKTAAAATSAATSLKPQAAPAAASLTPTPPSPASPAAASAAVTPAAAPSASTPTAVSRRGIPIVPPPPIPVEALARATFASAATTVAAADPAKIKKAKPMSKREAQRLARAARRAARAQLHAFVSATQHRRTTPSRARLLAAITAARSASTPRPPRLLPTGSTTEKLLWASQPGHPLPLRVLAPLIHPATYTAMCDAASAASASATAATEPALHTVVYAVGRESSVATVWLGALQAAADLASALSAGTSQLPAAVAHIAGLPMSTEATPAGETPAGTTAASTESSSSSSSSTATTPPISSQEAAKTTAATPSAPAAYVYILVHTTLSPDDAAVLQQELQYQFTQLRTTPAGAELAGLSVLTAQDVSPVQLAHVLEHAVDVRDDDGSAAARVGQSAVAYGARGSRTTAAAAAAPPLSPEAAEAKRTFAEVYRLMLELPGLTSSTASTSTSTSTSAPHPDALVADAVAVAALTQVLLHRKEAHLRAQLAAAAQSNAATADSEAVARAAQRVEMKTMVTEAVEEVSVRHEQATAHLVKTLSSMVGQWSLEKLSDTLEAIVRDEVKPIMDVLEERLGGAAAASASPPAAPLPLTSSPDSGDTSQHDEAAAASAALQERMSQVLAQLRELTQRTGTLAEAATAAAATAASAASASPSTETAAHAHHERDDSDRAMMAAAAAEAQAQAQARAAEEAELLRGLHERHEQHEARLSTELEELKSELRSLSTETRAAATAAASAADAATAATEAAAAAASTAMETSSHATTAAAAAASPSLSPEVLEKVVADAMQDVTQTLRHGIHASVVQQLDAYCDVHRSSNGNGDGSASYHHHEPSMPVLPVTSFELEEMLSRVVEQTVRGATDAMEGHVRAAVQKAVEGELAAAAPSRGTATSTSGLGDADESVKAALESLWAQVRAEAAEEEAVKTSQHNRQLLRLFRRQQHLQRGAAAAVDTAGALPLSYVALEEALRTVMRPYMTHMQASIAAAGAAPSSASSHAEASKPDAAFHAE